MVELTNTFVNVGFFSFTEWFNVCEVSEDPSRRCVGLTQTRTDTGYVGAQRERDWCLTSWVLILQIDFIQT